MTVGELVQKFFVRSLLVAAWLLSIAALTGWLILSIDKGHVPALFITSLGLVALLLPVPVWLSRRASPRLMTPATSRTNGTLKDVSRPYR